jgi:hypothetical protein
MSLRIVVLMGLIAGVAGNVDAVTCYEIVDASDVTLYRATVPPFPLEGSGWSAAQTRLRAQGRHLMWFEASACPEDFSSAAYASARPNEDANAMLSSRRGLTAGAIYTREGASSGIAGGTSGRAPGAVPSGTPMAAPSGGAKGYGK